MFSKNYTQRFSWLTQKLRKNLLSKKAEEIRLKKLNNVEEPREQHVVRVELCLRFIISCIF